MRLEDVMRAVFEAPDVPARTAMKPNWHLAHEFGGLGATAARLQLGGDTPARRPQRLLDAVTAGFDLDVASALAAMTSDEAVRAAMLANEATAHKAGQ